MAAAEAGGWPAAPREAAAPGQSCMVSHGPGARPPSTEGPCLSGPHPCALLSPGRLVWLPSHLQAPTQESRPPSILPPGCSQSLSPHISPPLPPPPPQPAPGRGRDLNSNLLPIVLRPKWVPAADPVPPGCPTLRCCPISWASPSTPRLQLPPIAHLPSARNACSPPPHPSPCQAAELPGAWSRDAPQIPRPYPCGALTGPQDPSGRRPPRWPAASGTALALRGLRRQSAGP